MFILKKALRRIREANWSREKVNFWKPQSDLIKSKISSQDPNERVLFADKSQKVNFEKSFKPGQMSFRKTSHFCCKSGCNLMSEAVVWSLGGWGYNDVRAGLQWEEFWGVTTS